LKAVLSGEEVISFSSNLKGSENLRLCFGKVEYKDNPNLINFDDCYKMKNKSDNEQMAYFFKNIIGIKNSQWSYEQEYRLISNNNSKDGDSTLVNLEGYAPFLKVCGLIMGKQLLTKDSIKDMCSRHMIDLYQAKFSKKKYIVDVEKILDYGNTPEILPKILY